MKKFLNVEKITNNKWLNLYSANYKLPNGKNYVYYFASRRNDKNLTIKGSNYLDAVRVLPYYKQNNKTYVVVIKEFRHPLDKYIYSTPAGLIDEGETPKIAAIREVEEEIGASVLNLKLVQQGAYTSAGLTDEKIAIFEAEIKLDKQQKLEESEEITFLSIPVEEIINFVDNNEFCLQSALHLKMFYYKNINNI